MFSFVHNFAPFTQWVTAKGELEKQQPVCQNNLSVRTTCLSEQPVCQNSLSVRTACLSEQPVYQNSLSIRTTCPSE
jgi:hypothetical protein